jgi:hypothetical protein
VSAAEAQPLIPPGYRWSEKHGAAVWGGGRRPEHPDARKVERVPYAVRQGYDWIGRARLSRAQKVVLLQLMVRVCSKTWRWPPKHKDAKFKGSSMEELAHACGYSRRHTQRVLAELEALGIVLRVDLRPRRNEYQIVAKALRKAGEQGKVIEAEFRQRLRERREEALAAADAHIDSLETQVDAEGAGGEGGVTSAAESTAGHADPATDSAVTAAQPASSTEPPALARADRTPPPLPKWLLGAASRAGVDPRVLGRLCRAVHVAGGDPGPWTQNGELGRPVLREWRKADAPEPELWERWLEGLVKVDADGEFPRPRKNSRAARGSKRLLQLVRHAENRQRALEALEATSPSLAVASVAPAPSQADSGALEVGHAGGTPPVPHAPGDGGAWQEHMRLFREQLGSLFDIWLVPLVLEGVAPDGRVTVRAPTGTFALWVAEHYATQLLMAAGGPVRLVWGVGST